jgi:hypothetical protein
MRVSAAVELAASERSATSSIPTRLTRPVLRSSAVGGGAWGFPLAESHMTAAGPAKTSLPSGAVAVNPPSARVARVTPAPVAVKRIRSSSG